MYYASIAWSSHRSGIREAPPSVVLRIEIHLYSIYSEGKGKAEVAKMQVLQKIQLHNDLIISSKYFSHSHQHLVKFEKNNSIVSHVFTKLTRQLPPIEIGAKPILVDDFDAGNVD